MRPFDAGEHASALRAVAAARELLGESAYSTPGEPSEIVWEALTRSPEAHPDTGIPMRGMSRYRLLNEAEDLLARAVIVLMAVDAPRPGRRPGRRLVTVPSIVGAGFHRYARQAIREAQRTLGDAVRGSTPDSPSALILDARDRFLEQDSSGLEAVELRELAAHHLALAVAAFLEWDTFGGGE